MSAILLLLDLSAQQCFSRILFFSDATAEFNSARSAGDVFIDFFDLIIDVFIVLIIPRADLEIFAPSGVRVAFTKKWTLLINSAMIAIEPEIQLLDHFRAEILCEAKMI
jgi:hypothetical protein